jgi:L-phenylalanine/L-methionine N-acetyltransferase
MAEITIRPVEPEDWPAIAEILDQPRVIAGTLQLPFRSQAFQRQRLETNDRGRPHLGAVIDGKVVGDIMLVRTTNERRAHAASFGMCVHDAYQGRGVGAALLSALLDLTDRWLNVRRMELTVFADNAPAIALYERFGFEREGVLRDYALRDGVFVDALAMARTRN